MENKQFLYHKVPVDENGKEKVEGNILHPLYELKDKYPELYQSLIKKYEGREWVPEQSVPSLDDCKWGDVLQFSAIDPKELKQALVEAGFEPKEMKFYQIDPNLLDPKKTTVYLYNEDDKIQSDSLNYAEYNPTNIASYSTVTDKTKDYYRERKERGERPLLFVGIPHIFHKGSLDTSNLPVITV